MWFTRVSINNPVFATMMMAALLVLGLFSAQRLPVEQFPDVAFPVIVIQTDYPGAAPESVEEEVTRPIEEAVNTISGINVLSSRSYESQSLVIVEYLDGRQVRWKNLEKVWTLLGSEKEFLPYVQEGVSSYLKGA